MSKTIDVFETTAGVTVKKVEDKNGVIRRFADGTPITPSSYGAYKSHEPASERFQRGNLQDIEDTDSLGFPFDSRTFKDIGQYDQGSTARRRIQKNNQWVGFLASEETPDDPFKAAEDYEKMVSELTGVENADRRREIKERYNIGGS